MREKSDLGSCRHRRSVLVLVKECRCCCDEEDCESVCEVAPSRGVEEEEPWTTADDEVLEFESTTVLLGANVVFFFLLLFFRFLRCVVKEDIGFSNSNPTDDDLGEFRVTKRKLAILARVLVVRHDRQELGLVSVDRTWADWIVAMGDAADDLNRNLRRGFQCLLGRDGTARNARTLFGAKTEK